MSVSKAAADRNHRILLELVALPGNDICADCKSRAPRWASHNLGIFICVRCATVHRKIGTHVTKVKSVTLDSWSKEQVEIMKNIGNVKANQKWNPDERRNPPPTNMEESERDSELEKYIRAKYEYKRYIDRSAQVAAQLGPSRSKDSVSVRSRTAPPRTAPSPTRTLVSPASAEMARSPTGLDVPSGEPRSASAGLPNPSFSSYTSDPINVPQRTTSQPFVASSSPYPPAVAPVQASMNPFPMAQPPPQNQQRSLSGPVWNDLASLQGAASNSSLPLQYQSPSPFSQTQSSPFSQPQPLPAPMAPAANINTNPYANLSVGGAGTGPAFPSSFGSQMNPSPNSRSSSLPVFGSGTPPANMMGSAPNPFQQQFLSPSPGMPMSPSSPVSVNPFAQQFTGVSGGMGMQTQQPTQQQTPPFQQNPYGTGMLYPTATTQSPFPFSPGTYQPQYQQPQQRQPEGYSSASPISQEAQQAQQVFQSMASGANAFGQRS